MFESREICGKMWQNATMLGGDNVRKEKFKIKCPKRIQFGDPLYYEDFKDKPERLKKLVVDYKPKPEFKAGVLLTEMEYPEFPGYMARTMTVYFAPEQYLSTYLDEKMYPYPQFACRFCGGSYSFIFHPCDGGFSGHL